MLANYIVPPHVAWALKDAGFNEPCLAKWPSTYCDLLKPVTSDQFHYKNSELEQSEFTAPLYDQILMWFLDHNLNIVPYYLEGRMVDAAKSLKGSWVCTVHSVRTTKQLWPQMLMSIRINNAKYLHDDKHKAYDQAIIAAIRLLK